jgi:hypothetical protein
MKVWIHSHVEALRFAIAHSLHRAEHEVSLSLGGHAKHKIVSLDTGSPLSILTENDVVVFDATNPADISVGREFLASTCWY